MRFTGSAISTFFRRVRNRDLLMPYLLSILLAVFLPLILVSAFFFFNIYHTMAVSAQQNNAQATEATSEELRATFNMFDSLAIRFARIPALSPSAFLRDEYNALDTFRLYNALSLKYDDINLFYVGSERVLTMQGINHLDMFFPTLEKREKLIADILLEENPQFINTVDYGQALDGSHILYVKPLPPVAAPTHYVIFLIRHATLLQNMLAVPTAQLDGTQLLIDESNRILWTNYTGDRIALQRILFERYQPDKYGRIQYGNQLLFLSERELTHGLALLHLNSTSKPFERLSNIVTVFIIICVVVLVVGGLMLVLVLKKAYRPIRRIVDALPQTDEASELELLQTAVQPGSFLKVEPNAANEHFSSEQLRGLFVLNTIQGRRINTEDLENLSHNLQMDLSAPYHFVCCILVDTKRMQLEREDILRLLGTAQDVQGYYYTGLDGRTTVGILSAGTQNLSERMLLGSKILAAFPQEYNATVTVGLPYADFDHISHSYLQARTALDYRFIQGSRTVIAADDLPTEIQSSDYPTVLLQDFAHSVRLWNEAAITQQLSAILQYIQNHQLPLYQAKTICYELVSTFLREASEINRRAATNLYMKLDIFSLSEFDSVPELAHTIQAFSEQIVAFMDDNASRKNELFLKQCDEHLTKNIANYQFSIDAMADHMGISPQYLRKRYKALTGRTVSDTLNEMRIERAKELLSTTQYDINAIIAEIGYLDSSSFIRKFKNTTGVTPGKYREQQK